MKSEPIERKPAELLVKHIAGSRPLSLHWKCSATANGKKEKALESTLDCEMTETTRGIDGEGNARVRWGYRSFEHDAVFDGEKTEGRLLKAVSQHMLKVSANVEVDGQGKITRQTADDNVTAVPASFREAMRETHQRVVFSLKALAVPLPNRLMQPKETWTQNKLELPLFTGLYFAPSSLDMTYTYLGTRMRDGRPEAVIGLSGKIKGPWNHPEGISGRLEGTAVLDLNAGQISQVDVQVNYSMEREEDRFNGGFDVQFRRAVGR